MIAAQAFKESVENPSNTVACLFDKEREKRIEENRQIVKSIARTVLFCGRQLMHRVAWSQGEAWSVREPGLFSCFTQSFFSEGDPTLAAHLQTETVSRVTYLSPQSQNEMIDVIGKHYIQKKLVKEILESKYYAILADEARSHNEEKLRYSLRRC